MHHLSKQNSQDHQHPWMNDININKLQRERDYWRREAHKNPTGENWGTYLESTTKIKKAIKEKKFSYAENFYLQKTAKKFAM